MAHRERKHSIRHSLQDHRYTQAPPPQLREGVNQSDGLKLKTLVFIVYGLNIKTIIDK